jgi:hypothetical protein
MALVAINYHITLPMILSLTQNGRGLLDSQATHLMMLEIQEYM